MSVTAVIYSLKPTNFRFIKRFKRRVRPKSEQEIDLDKSWDVMSYILTGVKGFTEKNILSEIIFPQENIRIDFHTEDEEIDTEWFSFISPEKVDAINQKIQKISEQEFKTLFNKRDFDKIRTYPDRQIWSGENNFNYIYFYFKDVKKIFEEAAQKENYIGIIRNA